MTIDTGHLAAAVLLAYVAAIAVIDLRTHRIPNSLTVVSVLLSIALSSIGAGLDGAVGAAAGLGVGLLATLPMYLLKAMGAGDVKAFAAVGAGLGVPGVFAGLCYALIAGGVLVVAWLALARGWAATAQRLHANLWLLGADGSVGEFRPADGRVANRRHPYGLAIALGTALALLQQGRLGFLLTGAP